MGFQSTALAFAVSGLSGPQKAVLVALAHCKNQKTGQCNPKQETLAAMTSLSERAVRDALTYLEDHELIERHATFVRRSRQADSYTLHIDPPSSQEPAADAGIGSASHRQEAPQVPAADAGSDTGTTRRAIETTSLRTGTKTTGSEQEYSSDFEELWHVYPRKESKAAAFKAYRAALKQASHEVILAGVAKYRLATLGSDPQYIKLAGGWLRDRRWEDEPTIAATRPNSSGRLIDEWNVDASSLFASQGAYAPRDIAECLRHPGYPPADCRRCAEEQMEGAA